MIELPNLTPAAERGWALLFALAEQRQDWVLVGGQMVFALACERGVAQLARPTDDMDVVVDLRTSPQGTKKVSRWLQDQGLELSGVTAEGVGHRFHQELGSGRGRVVFDVLAPEKMGTRASLLTQPPARTVEAPGARQALDRARAVTATALGAANGTIPSGTVLLPTLLGGLVVKAEALGIPVRPNRARDWQDAALLLSLVADPLECRQECDKTDRKRLARLRPLLHEPVHAGWARLPDDRRRAAEVTLQVLLG